jgi:hypothetical protein
MATNTNKDTGADLAGTVTNRKVDIMGIVSLVNL